MKKLLYIAAFIAATAVSYAQGTFTGVNRISGTLDAPVFNVGGATRLDGTSFMAQFYGGPANSAGGLVALGSTTTFRTGTGIGYITSAGTLSVPGVAGGSVATLQLRAWTGAATWEAATVRGESPMFQSPQLGGAGTPPSTPSNLVGGANGLQSFSLVPEPSTIALGAIGLAALLFRRRK